MQILGQIAQYGGLLVSADARELIARVPDDSVALVYLDPPHGATKASEKAIAELRECLRAVVEEAYRVLAPTGNLFYTIPPVGTLSADAFDARFALKQLFRKEPREISRPLSPGYRLSAGPRSNREVTLWVGASEEAIYNPLILKQSEEELRQKFPREDERGRYRLLDLTVPGSRPNLVYEWEGITPPKGRAWRVTRDRMQVLAEEERIEVRRHSIALKHYADEAPPLELPTEWDDLPIQLAHAERQIGDQRIAGQKPLDFARRLVKMGSDRGGLVLDPFCGTGTTLVASQEASRHWIGGDLRREAIETAARRLINEAGMPSEGWLTEQDALASFFDFSTGEASLLTHVGEVEELQGQVEELQRKVTTLVSQFHEIRQTLAGDTPDDAIETLQTRIQSFLDAEAPPSGLDEYVLKVKEWLTEWELLDSKSQALLPQAEFLMDALGEDVDYSPFVIQYCKVLENELLLKLFARYGIFFQTNVNEVHELLKDGLRRDKTKPFAKKLSRGDTKYTLGEMVWVMKLIKKPDGKTLGESSLLQHFRDFASSYFSDHVRDLEYLEQIERIQKDYRNKAAHPYLLDLKAGIECQNAVRRVLREFLQSYQGTD